MGIIDQSTFRLLCPSCGVTEVATAYEKGSQYSGGHWPTSLPLQHFAARWVGGGREELGIDGATCLSCGATATISCTYS